MAVKYIGIDIGTYNIKLADITVNKNAIMLGAFTVVNTPRFLVQNGRVSDQEELLNLLKEVISKKGFKHKKAVIILNDSIVITRDIEMPSAKQKELEQMVKLDASEYLPGNISEYTIRYKVLQSSKENSRNTNYIMMSSIKNDLIMDFYDVFSKAGLKPVSIDTTLNCMIKYLVSQSVLTKPVKAAATKTIALLDLGASSIKIVILKDGIPSYQKVINQSSQKIDVLIANTLNIERDEAEEHKIKYGLSYLTDINSEEISKTVGSIINEQMNQILSDVYKHLQNFNTKNNSTPIDEIWLMGGMSRMKGLCRSISEAFSIPCSIVKVNDYIGFSLDDKIKLAGTHKMEEDFPLFTNLVGAVIKGDKIAK